MQKNNRFYTFLLSHTTKEKIFIRKLEISKKLVHTSAASLILSLGIGSLGIYGLTGDNFSNLASFVDSNASKTLTAKLDSKTVQPKKLTKENPPKINYDRPSTDEELAQNSGGPTSGSFQLTAVDSDKEETAIEKKLNLIEKTSNPRFLPTIWAHLGKINNEFGFRRNPFGGRSYEFHSGMDIDGEKGDMLVAPANGQGSQSRMARWLRIFNRNRPRKWFNNSLWSPFKSKSRCRRYNSKRSTNWLNRFNWTFNWSTSTLRITLRQ